MSKFEVNGKSYPVPEDLTLGEACTLEQEFGVDVQALEKGKGGLAALAGLTWVAMNRVDKTVTPDHVRGLSFSEIVLPDLDEATVEDAELPPSVAAGAVSKRRVVESPGLATIRAASGSRAS